MWLWLSVKGGRVLSTISNKMDDSEILTTIKTSQTIDCDLTAAETASESSDDEECEWGFPLVFEEDDEDVEEITDENEQNDRDLASPIASEGTFQSEDTDSPNLANESSTDQDFPDFRCAVIQSIFPGTSTPRSTKYFCRKLHLNLKKPSKPRSKPRKVTIDFTSVSPKWEKDINIALRAIETAVPGLLFKQVKSTFADIYVDKQTDGKDSSTEGNLRSFRTIFGTIKSKSIIELDFEHESLKRCSNFTHELLHALGFEHEHQRRDAGHFLEVLPKSSDNSQVESSQVEASQVKASRFKKPLTPFDYYSIMLYPIGDFFHVRDKDKRKALDKFKEDKERPKSMSEFDKIALNLTYPPARIKGVYEPVLVPETGMYYCSRSVMVNHNQPGPALVNKCGQCSDSNNSADPDSGPNCPACRVLSLPRNLGNDRWQGQSGFVYCGNEGCGPDINGPCDACGRVINYG